MKETTEMSQPVFRRVSPAVGAEVVGLDLREPLSGALEKTLRDAWYRYGLLLFRDQDLSLDDLSRIASAFGEVSLAGEFGKRRYVSNVAADEDAVAKAGELPFHCELANTENPLYGLILYGIEVPPESAGGATIFANAHLAYETLPDAVKARIKGRDIVLRAGHYDQAVPDIATHPVVFPHPITGEAILFWNPRHYVEMVGLSSDESAPLVDEFSKRIHDPSLHYRHTWRQCDLIVWDNFKLQHAREDFDPNERRHLHRTQLGAPVPVEA
jgi:taurine dioxygenase